MSETLTLSGVEKNIKFLDDAIEHAREQNDRFSIERLEYLRVVHMRVKEKMMKGGLLNGKDN